MIRITRKLIRESGSSIFSRGRRRPVVVELHPHGDGRPGPAFIGLRLQGTRTTYYLPIDWCFREAVRAAARAKARERRERRKAKQLS